MGVVELRRQSTRKQKRLATRGNGQGQNQPHPNEPPKGLYLNRISPMTENQTKTFDAYSRNKNLLLHGSAGTGKTFISLYLALLDVMNGNEDYNKVVIIRSVVPTRDMGFLPGSAKDKSKVYEAPYYSICTELFGRGDAYDVLKQKNLVEFQTTSFIRGLTFNNCIIVLDEVQNCVFQELDSVLTRVGNNCKIIFSGDFKQSDLTKDSDRSGILDFMKIIKRIKSFENIEFTKNDIVRSQLVKDYIIAKEDLNIR
jgi:phosphate starvation-inducible protein PhoH